MRKLLLMIVAAVLSAGTPWSARADPFADGLAAFDAGKFAKALAIWGPLARNGDGKSEAALGFMYFTGNGVPRDDQRSLFWFRRAADAGQPTAQFFLGLQYFLGRGVPRDLARAYSWCDIALTNGYSESLSCRDAAELEMTPDDKRRAARFTAKFFRTHEF